nr:hypothetical protein [Tanacetum cinerariifolium]
MEVVGLEGFGKDMRLNYWDPIRKRLSSYLRKQEVQRDALKGDYVVYVFSSKPEKEMLKLGLDEFFFELVIYWLKICGDHGSGFIPRRLSLRVACNPGRAITSKKTFSEPVQLSQISPIPGTPNFDLGKNLSEKTRLGTWCAKTSHDLEYDYLDCFNISPKGSFHLAFQSGISVAIAKLGRKLELAQKQKDEIQLTVENFNNSSKNLSKLIDCQIVDKYKTGLGHNVVSPPYTGNFMPPKPDLSFSGLEEFVNEPIVSEPAVKKPAAKTSEAKASADKPKVVRKNNGAPIFEEWVSDSEDEAMLKPKIEKKTVKPILMRSGLVSLTTARPVNTAQPRTTVNSARQMTNGFNKAHLIVKMCGITPYTHRGYAEAIVVPPILAEHFELKHSLINMMTLDQFFGLEKDNPHDRIPDQDSLNSAANGNLLERRTQAVLTIIENKSKVCSSRNKLIVSQVKSSDVNSSSSFEIAKLTHAVNQQTSAVTTAMTAILKQFQATPPLASVKSIEEISVVNYNQGNSGYHPPSVANQIRPSGELKAITTRSDLVLDGPSVPMPPPFINPEEDERAEETLTDPKLAEDPRHPHILYPSRMNQEKHQEKDEIQIHKFWQMFKQLLINITLVDALILILKYQKMLKALLSNKEKLLELANTPLNKNCSVVILKKLPEKLGDPRKFLILCGFSELKCKALADLGASINLWTLSVWKKLGLPELISTCMTLELANREICTPARIARDVFVSVGKFTFPADFVIVDYESDPQVPFILGRPFLRTARALIDVHGEEMILHDGDERLTLNMRHDTSSYSNQPHKESINMINIYNDSYEDYPEDLFATNHLCGNPTFSSHTDLISPEVINPLSENTTSSSPDHLLKEFADELALITFPSRNDDLLFDNESDLREIEYLLNHDPTKEIDFILEDSVEECNLADPNNDLVDTIPGMFIDEHTLDYSSPPLYDDVDDDLVELESDNDDVYDDPFDSKEYKIKESKLLNDELDPPRSSDFLPSPEFTIRVVTDKNDYNPPLSELPFHKEVPGSETLLSFSFENEEKVFNPGILTSKGVHTSHLSELYHQGPKAFRVIKIFESPMEIFVCSYEEDIRILDVSCLHFYPP